MFAVLSSEYKEERLVVSAVRFVRSWSSCPMTRPSRASASSMYCEYCYYLYDIDVYSGIDYIVR
jgi:hypothetical protein